MVLEIYPEPFTDKRFFGGRAELFDIQGHKLAEGTNSIETVSLQEGIYILKTENLL